MDCEARVYKRGKARKDGKGEAVFVTLKLLDELGALPMARAAEQLGLSVTALKGACRKLGVARWPYFSRPALQHAHSRPAVVHLQDACTQTDLSFGGVYGCEIPALVDAEGVLDVRGDGLREWWD
jgi:hypothetical protein